LLVSTHIRSDAEGLVLKRLFTMLLVSYIFYGCEKDPISGLERGWIWDTIGLEKEDEDKSTDGTMYFEISYVEGGNLKIYEGITTAGQPVFDIDAFDGDIFTEIFPKGDYTIKWVYSYSWGGDYTESESFTHGSCTTINLSNNLYIYENDCP